MTRQLDGRANCVPFVAFSGSVARFVSGSGDQSIRLWHVQSGLPLRQPLSSHTDAVFPVVFSSDEPTCSQAGRSTPSASRIPSPSSLPPRALPLQRGLYTPGVRVKRSCWC
ncbi:hypothetical protein FPV67DRAFT_161710 [Lyophyllum atratum]|nr:hypothetical protein FPV67DRAFT_161710 [Lyophyllum atratum]